VTDEISREPGGVVLVSITVEREKITTETVRIIAFAVIITTGKQSSQFTSFV
jgi:hypothetical protein